MEHPWTVKYAGKNLEKHLPQKATISSSAAVKNILKSQAEEIIKEEQAGFRVGRNTTEQIFNLGILCL